MESKIKDMRAQVAEAIARVGSKEELDTFWQQFLSKKGRVQELMKSLGGVAPEERPAMGKLINEFKAQVTAAYEEAAARIAQAELARRNASEQIDITLPAKTREEGALHPITLTKNQMISVFAGMGFQIFEGPEIEDDDHNFTRLNVAKNHPARDMQAAHPDQPRPDPGHGRPEAAHQGAGAGARLPLRQRRHPLPPVPPDGGPGGGQAHHPVRPAGDAGRVR